MAGATELRGARGSRGRRRWRRRAAVLAVVLLGYTALCVHDVRFATVPVDATINLLPAPEAAAEWRADEPTLVVLLHGLSRSSWSLWRLERALRAHGYQVLNHGYASTDGRGVGDYAAGLHAALAARLDAAPAPAPRLVFVGHSLGGLVIRALLARPDAPAAAACLFLGTPQRGAALAAERRELWAFRWFLGDGAALQLVPGDPLYERLGPVPAARVGVLYGKTGDEDGWNDDVPGDDDGTVAVREARLPEADVTRGLHVGHFRMGFDAAVIREVLCFATTGSFTPVGSSPR